MSCLNADLSGFLFIHIANLARIIDFFSFANVLNLTSLIFSPNCCPNWAYLHILTLINTFVVLKVRMITANSSVYHLIFRSMRKLLTNCINV
jgi:hypothetical protein